MLPLTLAPDTDPVLLREATHAVDKREQALRPQPWAFLPGRGWRERGAGRECSGLGIEEGPAEEGGPDVDRTIDVGKGGGKAWALDQGRVGSTSEAPLL